MATDTAKSAKNKLQAELELEEQFKLAALSAKNAIITSKQDVELLDAEIIQWYKTGEDDGVLIQPCKVKVDGEESARKYSIRGLEAIKHLFGKPIKQKNGDFHYEKVEYDTNGIPLKCKVPDCDIDESSDTYWWGLRKV